MTSHSYSHISTAYRCGQLYKYLVIDNLKTDQPESGDMKFGTAIHLAIESILTNPKADYMGLFELFWDLERGHNNKYGRYTWDDLREQGHTLLARFERLHAKKFKAFKMEERLYGRIGNIEVEGTPDFIGDYEGKKSLIDFKTSGSRYNKDKIKVSEQLYLYTELARQAFGFIPEQVVYVVFVKGSNPSIQCISEDFNQTRSTRILQNLEKQGLEIEQKIKNNSFTRNYGACIMGEMKCQYFDKCHNGDKND